MSDRGHEPPLAPCLSWPSLQAVLLRCWFDRRALTAQARRLIARQAIIRRFRCLNNRRFDCSRTRVAEHPLGVGSRRLRARLRPTPPPWQQAWWGLAGHAAGSGRVFEGVYGDGGGGARAGLLLARPQPSMSRRAQSSPGAHTCWCRQASSGVRIRIVGNEYRASMARRDVCSCS